MAAAMRDQEKGGFLLELDSAFTSPPAMSENLPEAVVQHRAQQRLRRMACVRRMLLALVVCLLISFGLASARGPAARIDWHLRPGCHRAQATTPGEQHTDDAVTVEAGAPAAVPASPEATEPPQQALALAKLLAAASDGHDGAARDVVDRVQGALATTLARLMRRENSSDSATSSASAAPSTSSTSASSTAQSISSLSSSTPASASATSPTGTTSPTSPTSSAPSTTSTASASSSSSPKTTTTPTTTTPTSTTTPTTASPTHPVTSTTSTSSSSSPKGTKTAPTTSQPPSIATHSSVLTTETYTTLSGGSVVIVTATTDVPAPDQTGSEPTTTGGTPSLQSNVAAPPAAMRAGGGLVTGMVAVMGALLMA